MATITPLERIPEFDKHQIQQLLLQRDESVERLARIDELEAEIQQVKAAAEAQIAALTESNDGLYACLMAMRTAFSNVEGTPEFLEKQSRVQAEKRRAMEKAMEELGA